MDASEPQGQEEDAGGAAFNNPFAYDPAVQATLTPLWREVAWAADWVKLRCSPVYCGTGVPRGQGEAVLLIPGFMAGDFLMLELQGWLKRIGYRPYLSNIVWNNDCPDRTARTLAQRLARISDECGMRVRVVGHSLGGMLAKSLVQDHPQLVDRIITLGSPHRSFVKAHPAVVGVWNQLKRAQSGLIGRNLRASCGTGHCLCPFVKNLLDPQPRAVAQFSVYSRNDGVADWSSCIEADAEANTEVRSTHIGMIFNPEVYRAIAQRLAQSVVGGRRATSDGQAHSKEHANE